MSTIPDTTTPSAQELNRLFSAACSYHENNDFDKAVSYYSLLTEKVPPSALLHFNFGLALYELGEFEQAEEQYSAAAAIDRKDPDIPYNRGLNLRQLGRIEEAADCFKLAYSLGDASVDTLYNLALCFQDLEQIEAAEQLYSSILKAVPDHQASLNNYAYLCHKYGNISRAEELYQRLLALDPSHLAAQHMLNAVSGETPDTAPLEYIETVFDNYAGDFEKSLVENLHYRTPALLKEKYLSCFKDEKREHCLDLGCGTGLAGLEFRSICNRLTGLDISEEMLQVAAEKNIYDALLKDDILSHLRKSRTDYDLIVAADVFIYLGDLHEIFLACATKSRDHTIFLFSVETTEAPRFELKTTGRFGHSLQYIRQLSEETGWTLLEADSARLRKDKGDWIDGYLLLLEKRAS